MINQWIGFGRLCTEPELKTTNGGKSVVTFSIACDDGSGENKKTYFFPIVAWDKTAELIVKYFHKGQLIGIRGKLQQREYDAKDGSHRSVIEIRAEELQFVPNGQPQNAAQNAAPAPAPAQAPAAQMPPAPAYIPAAYMTPPPAAEGQAPAPAAAQQVPVQAPYVYGAPYTPDSDLPF